jgi:hypothetical protein
MRRRWDAALVALGLVAAGALGGLPSPRSAGADGSPIVVAGVYVPTTWAQVSEEVTARTIDSAGRILFVSGHRLFRAEPDGTLTHLAGNGAGVLDLSSGPALDAVLGNVRALGTDAAGNVYLVDSLSIRKVSTSGTISLVAGVNASMMTGADGALAAEVSVLATNVVVGPTGDLYFNDYSGSIRKVVAATGRLQTVVPSGAPLDCATLNGPTSGVKAYGIGSAMAIDAAGTIFASAACGAGARIIKVVGTTSTVIAGGGSSAPDGAVATAAELGNIAALSLSGGNLYITTMQFVLRLESNGRLTRVAGTTGVCDFSDGTPAARSCVTGATVRSDGSIVTSRSSNTAMDGVGVITNGTLDVLTGSANPADGITAAGAPIAPVVAFTSAPDGTLMYAGWEQPKVRTVDRAGRFGTIVGNGAIGSMALGGQATASPSVTSNDLHMSDAGELYVTQVGMVAKVTADGTLVKVAGTGVSGNGPDSTAAGAALTTAISPMAVTTDHAGNVYIASVTFWCGMFCGQGLVIRKVAPSGAISTVYSRADGSFFDLATDIDGTLVLASYLTDELLRIDPASGTVTSIAVPGAGGAGALDIDRDGTIFLVTDTGLWRITAAGAVTKVSAPIVPPSSPSFSSTVGVGIDDAGTVYAAWNSVITKFPLVAAHDEPTAPPSTTTTVPNAGSAGPTGSTAMLAAVSPVRLFDTRPGEAQGAVTVIKQRYGGSGDVLRVKLAGVAGIPESGAGAVSLNVTVADPDGSGFVTIYPCGDRPTASSLNFVAGQVVPNAVIAPLSATGEICLFSNVPTHLLADVNGWFRIGAGLTPLAPARLFDTRPDEAQGSVTVTKQTYGGPDNVLKVKVTGVSGVPETGVGAVSLNVTVVGPEGAGFVTVYPCGDRPNASSLNFVAGQVAPNAVIAPVSANGEVCFFSNVPTHLLSDVNGWFAKASGFNALSPVRVFDTRPGEAQGAVSVTKQTYSGPDNVLRVRVTGAMGVPSSGVSAVSLNVTVADPAGAGFVTVYPCGDRPNASSLNFVAGQVVPNAVIAPVSASGEICLFSNVPTHVLADINGWFSA